MYLMVWLGGTDHNLYGNRMNMGYIYNPKTKDSGVICAIPQSGVCPVGCADCFFQSGRSYLEPLDENLPNIPSEEDIGDCVVRINDGNDSAHEIDKVIACAKEWKHHFYNTSMGNRVSSLPGPVVLTVNPHKKTDHSFYRFPGDIPENLMFVRVRVNTWNLDLVRDAVEYYTESNIPVVLTFMAYYERNIPDDHRGSYVYRKRTQNSYWVLKPEKWWKIHDMFRDNPYVSTCGHDPNSHACHRCGVCVREYWHYYDKNRGA